jgi:hypothetical protein
LGANAVLALKTDATKYPYTIWPDQRWVYNKTVMGYSAKKTMVDGSDSKLTLTF